MPSDVTLAYLAGAIDSDGYITIPSTCGRLADGSTRRYYVAQIGLGQITEEIPRLLYETFGGHITFYTPPKVHHVPRWVWHATNTRASTAAECLRPYLLLKSRQADLVIELAKRLDANRGQLVSEDEMAARRALCEEARALNRPRAGRKQLGGVRPGTKLEDLPEDLRIREMPR